MVASSGGIAWLDYRDRAISHPQVSFSEKSTWHAVTLLTKACDVTHSRLSSLGVDEKNGFAD
jgi:hypothetical protein